MMDNRTLYSDRQLLSAAIASSFTTHPISFNTEGLQGKLSTPVIMVLYELWELYRHSLCAKHQVDLIRLAFKLQLTPFTLLEAIATLEMLGLTVHSAADVECPTTGKMLLSELFVELNIEKFVAMCQ